MSDEKNSRSGQDIVEAFDKLFDQTSSAETAERAREDLREAGFDPEKLISDGIDRIQTTIRNHPSFWRIRNPEAIRMERAKLEAIELSVKLKGEELRAYVESIIKRLDKVNPNLVPLQMQRGGTRMSDDDLLTYLRELFFIAHKAGLDIEEDNSA